METNNENRTERQEQAAQRREWLRQISAKFQTERELLVLNGAEYIPTINEMLRTYYQKQNAVTDLRTYDQWKKDGYQVRKGEKAFLVWGKPQHKDKTIPNDAEPDDQQEPATMRTPDFYPVCYLFDITQCHKAAKD